MLQSHVRTHRGGYGCQEIPQGFKNESLFTYLGENKAAKRQPQVILGGSRRAASEKRVAALGGTAQLRRQRRAVAQRHREKDRW